MHNLNNYHSSHDYRTADHTDRIVKFLKSGLKKENYSENEKDLFEKAKFAIEKLERYDNQTLLNSVSILRFGIEIEKEIDPENYFIDVDHEEESALIRNGWNLEKDGSLDADSGVELVSPIFPLAFDFCTGLFISIGLDEKFSDKHELNSVLNDLSRRSILSMFKKNSLLKMILETRSTKRCGGHMRVSILDLNSPLLGHKIFKRMIKPIYFLLCSMYPSRAKNNYCQFKKMQDLLSSPSDKYQAIKVENTAVELRIFSSPSSFNQLDFRLRFLQNMFLSYNDSVDNDFSGRQFTTYRVWDDMKNTKSDLYKVMRIAFNPQQIKEKASLVKNYIHEEISSLFGLEVNLESASETFPSPVFNCEN